VAAQFASIDDYISSFPDDVQPLLQQVRRTILDVVPEVDETISYGIPTMMLDGRYLVYFAGWKKHISVYPIPTGDAAFEQEIAPYRAAKGTLKFPLDKPIPYDVIKRATVLLADQRSANG
jgi:uncharacterized protein YdhG (YjbR/CyaY superfamily)